MEKIYPLPEALDGKEWSIKEDSQGSVDIPGRTVYVPLDNTETDYYVRMHELGHVKWSPATAKPEDGIDIRCIRAVEDCRINKKLVCILKTVFNPDYSHINFSKLSRDVQILGAVSTAGTTTQKSYFRRIKDPKDRRVARRASDHITSFSLYSDTLRVAKQLTNYLYPKSKEEVEIEEKEKLKDIPVSDVKREKLEKMKKEVTVPKEVDYGRDGPGEIKGKYGKMEIETVPLPKMIKPSFKRKIKSTDCGSIPRYVWRIKEDQKIYEKRKKLLAFAVLIDHSGSMALNPNDVEKAVELAPASVVATYSGNGDHGVLRIVSKNGRIASNKYMEPPCGGSNVIDVPALEWLVKQKGIPIWVSDGMVTGVGDMSFHSITDYCKQLKKTFNVTQLRTVNQLTPFIKKYRRIK
jgi:hypothetical protein